MFPSDRVSFVRAITARPATAQNRLCLFPFPARDKRYHVPPQKNVIGNWSERVTDRLTTGRPFSPGGASLSKNSASHVFHKWLLYSSGPLSMLFRSVGAPKPMGPSPATSRPFWCHPNCWLRAVGYCSPGTRHPRSARIANLRIMGPVGYCSPGTRQPRRSPLPPPSFRNSTAALPWPMDTTPSVGRDVGSFIFVSLCIVGNH